MEVLQKYPHPRVVLITRAKTLNLGNEALSVAWRDYLAERYSSAQVRIVERGPSYLKRYKLAAIKSATDPIKYFDNLVKKELGRCPPRWANDPSHWDVAHNPKQHGVLRFMPLRRALDLRRRLAKLNLGSTDYLNRLAYITSAAMVVVNPAGEFLHGATDTALYYLIEARAAQLSGIPTFFVNLSFEIDDQVLIDIADHVFSACEAFEFRDMESAEYFCRMGGKAVPIVCPDGAVLSPVDRLEVRGGKGVALAINGLQVREYGFDSNWGSIIEKIGRSNKVTLTSNEPATDRLFWREYLDIAGVTCDIQTRRFDDYAQFLSGFDVVVSSRLHTCVLGMLAGSPVIPVEIGTFKLTGFYNQIGMTDEPIRMDEDDWQAKLLEKIDVVSANGVGRIIFQDARLRVARESLKSGLDGVFTNDLLSESEKN